MPLAHSYSRAQLGIEAPLISIETVLSSGLPGVHIIGMAQTAVKEASERVRGALMQNNLPFPRGKVTVHLAPADLPKNSGRYDLAIALCILAAQNQIPQRVLDQYEIVGELSLSGQVRSIRGVLPSVLANQDTNRQLIVPASNASEAQLIKNSDVLLAPSLVAAVSHFTGQMCLPVAGPMPLYKGNFSRKLSDVRGQPAAKRALIIAAAGRHNLLMTGPPGSGKSMLASRLPVLIPAMSDAEALETAALASISRPDFDSSKVYQRPFRAPHHTASTAALVGGGSIPVPGEISLAHHGVLFLDELPEFGRGVLEALREPLETQQVVISRARYQTTFPAGFQLVAAMNPCPCGYFGDDRCECSLDQIHRYRRRVSGPLADRIDLHVTVAAQAASHLNEPPSREEDDDAESVILAARSEMSSRRKKANADLTVAEIGIDCRLSLADQHLLEQAIDKLQLSARAYFKVLKIGRTIADLAGSSQIQRHHLLEAISFRQLDRRAQVESF